MCVVYHEVQLMLRISTITIKIIKTFSILDNITLPSYFFQLYFVFLVFALCTKIAPILPEFQREQQMSLLCFQVEGS